jgi:predicted nucleic acid-binding OB-fold protein
MNFSLVFENSGDSIPFTTLSTETAEVLDYFVTELTARDNNLFRATPQFSNIVQREIKLLDDVIAKCNKFVYEYLDKYVERCTDVEYLNQDYLNRLHRDWVVSIEQDYYIQEKAALNLPAALEIKRQVKTLPTTCISTAMYKVNPENFDKYEEINIRLHTLEQAFNKVRYSTPDDKESRMPNPFSKTLVTNDICNFRLAFRHLGRTLYNKFAFFDLDLNYNDENTFDQLVGAVEVGLTVPQTIELSKEYTIWCAKHNKIPSGDFLNIGNISDLYNNLTKYRQVMYQNALQNNSFTIQLTKG